MMELTLKRDELRKWARNVLMFSAPALAIFFFQLSQGVELKDAIPLALFVVYGLLADYFKKLK